MISSCRTNNESRRRRQKNLARLLRPRHIAFIGGSQAAGAIAACQRAGFKGKIWVVNPARSEIHGIACVASIEELPEAPDAALLALSPERSIEAVKILANMNAGGAVCMAAGFAELGDEGVELQSALQRAAGDLAVLGPNCMGILNQFDNAAIWGSDNHIEQCGSRGAAIVSQSGAFLFGMTNVEQAFPLGYAISTGNQAITDMADCINAVLEDDRVSAIGLYLEGLNDGAALGEACWQALEKGIPVVALKGGDSPAGEAVALSHTGAMVVEQNLWQAFAERYAIAEVSSPKALVETLKLLTIGGVPRGPRLSAVSFSGGLNGLIASRASALGLKLEQPTAENSRKLRNRMPTTVPINNPFDLNLPWRSKTGMSMEHGDAIGEAITDLARDVSDMAVFLLDVPRPNELKLDADWLPAVESMMSVHEDLDIPCVVAGILPEGLDVELRRRLMNNNVAALLGFSETMEALSLAARLAEIHATTATKPPTLFAPGADTEQNMGTLMLNEFESKQQLAAFGLKIPQSWAGLAQDATKAAQNLGYPLALKILSESIAHKAEVGGVTLGIRSSTEVDTALAKMIAVLGTNGHQAEQFLLESMVANARQEFIIGIKRHSALGLALMVGHGGSAVEQLHRFATVLLPIDERTLDTALDSIGVSAQSMAHAGLREAVQAVARFAEHYRENLITLDVNPIIITANGDAIAADALIVQQR